MSLRAVSYGGGVQSTALLVMAARGTIDFPVFLMANTGDDSEHPATLAYVREVAMPYAAAHGIELVLLNRVMRDGTVETLHGRITRPDRMSVAIPIRMSSGKPASRSCTVDFKLRVTAKELKRRGACAETPATVAIGISVDEIQRANPSRAEPHERLVYPLLDAGMRRNDCEQMIRAEGLPVPPKSSCYFCPFHSYAAWQDLRRDTPDLFEQACALEENIRAKHPTRPMFMLDAMIPLREGIHRGVDTLPFDDGCDSSSCFT